MFYTYNQNNSGGSFDFKKSGISKYVIIEADSADEANRIAESIGLYFDGGGDCPCCGERWYSKWSDGAGDKVPSVHGDPIETATSYANWMGDDPDAFVHYRGGRIVPHKLKTR